MIHMGLDTSSFFPTRGQVSQEQVSQQETGKRGSILAWITQKAKDILLSEPKPPHTIGDTKDDRRTLIMRTLFETQRGCWAHEENSKQVEETLKIDRFVNGSYPLDQALFMRDNLRTFSADHPEVRAAIDPIVQVMETTCEIEGISYKGPEDIWTASSVWESRQSDTAECISAKLKAMKTGTSLLISAGRTDHAVSFEFKKSQDDTFTCHLYNTGDGVQFHPHKKARLTATKHEAVLNDIKLFPITWRDIPSSRLDSEFIRKLRSRESWTEFFLPVVPIDEFVTRWHSLLGAEDKKASLCERAYRHQGRISSCTYKSLSVWLHTAMDRIDPSGMLYKRFKHQTTATLLQRFDAQFPLNDPEWKPIDADIPLSVGELQRLRERAGTVQERRGRAISIVKPRMSPEDVEALIKKRMDVKGLIQQMSPEDVEELIDKITVRDKKYLLATICSSRKDVRTFSQACSEVHTRDGHSCQTDLKKIANRLEKYPELLRKTDPEILQQLVDAAMATGGCEELIDTVRAGSHWKITTFLDVYNKVACGDDSRGELWDLLARLRNNPGLVSLLSKGEQEVLVNVRGWNREWNGEFGLDALTSGQ